MESPMAGMTLQDVFRQEDKEWKEKMGMTMDAEVLRKMHEKHPMRTEKPVSPEEQAKLIAAEETTKKGDTAQRLQEAQRGLEAKKREQAKSKIEGQARRKILSLGKTKQALLKMGAMWLKRDEEALTHRRKKLAETKSRMVLSCMQAGEDDARIACATEHTGGMALTLQAMAPGQTVVTLDSCEALAKSGKPGSRFAASIMLQFLEGSSATAKERRQATAAQLSLLEESMTLNLPHAGCQHAAIHLARGEIKKAMVCYRHSAELGNPLAMWKLSCLLAEDKGEELGVSGESQEWCWKAAEAGVAEALNVKGCVIADETERQSADEPAPAAAMEAWQAAVDRGSPDAIFPLVRENAKYGPDCDPDGDDEQLLWQLVANGESCESFATACFMLSSKYLEPRTRSYNASKAAVLLARGAAAAVPEQGCVDFGLRLVDMRARCGHCGKFEPEPPMCVYAKLGTLKEASLKFCSRCKVETYCSVECQRAHWKAGHKRECKPLWPQQQILDAMERCEGSLRHLERTHIAKQKDDEEFQHVLKSLNN